MSPAPRHPLQNVLWLVGERVLRAAVTATVLGVVARHLEPAGFGRLNFAVAVVTIAAALANLSLEGLVVNELVRRPHQPGAVLGTAFRLRLLAGLGTAAGLSALATILAPEDAVLIAVVSLTLVLQPLDVIDLWFQRHLESRRTAVARFVGLSAGCTLKLCLVAADADLAAFAWALVADAAFIAIALAWAGWRGPYQSGRWSWDPEIARVLWQRGSVLAIATLAVSLAMRFDQLLVRHWLGEKAAGIYFAAARLTEFAAFAGSAISLSLFPGLAASHARSPAEYRARLQALFDALSALGWLVAVGCSTLGWLVIRVLYGPAYVEAGPVLVLLGWACLIALNATARWQFILLSASPALNLAAAVLHVAIVFPLGLWLLPRFGPVGAAASLLAASVASGVLTSWIFPPLRTCAALQVRGLLIPFTPTRWRALLGQFHSRATADPATLT
jgi:O-antigen/teichoic acid export membrane protein